MRRTGPEISVIRDIQHPQRWKSLILPFIQRLWRVLSRVSRARKTAPKERKEESRLFSRNGNRRKGESGYDDTNATSILNRDSAHAWRLAGARESSGSTQIARIQIQRP